MYQGMQQMLGASAAPVVGDRFDFLDIFFSYQVWVCACLYTQQAGEEYCST